MVEAVTTKTPLNIQKFCPPFPIKLLKNGTNDVIEMKATIEILDTITQGLFRGDNNSNARRTEIVQRYNICTNTCAEAKGCEIWNYEISVTSNSIPQDIKTVN